jgi:D-serine deaminase-like pyridoxal phosphate-dependent protein
LSDPRRYTTGPITVSTLKEAEYFAAAGYRNILYATAIVPNKLARVAKITRETAAAIHLSVDSPAMVQQLAARAFELDASFSVLIEIDCGERRSGAAAGSADIIAIADALAAAPSLELAGVMTHAGHSYSTNQRTVVSALASLERDAAVSAAKMLREHGFLCDMISIGSTPTVAFADHLDGVTEVRAGIYMLWDLAQFSRGLCSLDSIALSVLASVIGHNRAGMSLVLDAGALALSKDIGAQRFLRDVGYGYVCNAETSARFGTLTVTGVHQEHANVAVPDAGWFDRLPLGSVVRILPNHACLTAAAYDRYHVLRQGRVIDQWPRINGW